MYECIVFITLDMHLGEISFCNRIGFNIKSDEFKKQILDELELYHQKIIKKHHEKFIPDISVPVLRSMPHLMTLKTNGNPYYLYLTTFNGVNQCIFIDRKVQQGYFYPRMVIVKFWFDDSLFKKTLFSGEMVKSSTGSWLFLIHDLLVDSGEPQDSVNLVKRLNRTYDIMESMYTPDPDQDVATIQVKRHFHYEEHEDMLGTFKSNLPYTCRGVYFRPLFIKFKDILMNFDESLVVKVEKEKHKKFTTIEDIDPLPPPPPPPRQQAKVMMLQKTGQPDIYEVYDKNESVGVALVNSLEVSKMLRAAFSKSTPVDKFKFKCEFIEKFNKWSPLSNQL